MWNEIDNRLKAMFEAMDLPYKSNNDGDMFEIHIPVLLVEHLCTNVLKHTEDDYFSEDFRSFLTEFIQESSKCPSDTVACVEFGNHEIKDMERFVDVTEALVEENHINRCLVTCDIFEEAIASLIEMDIAPKGKVLSNMAWFIEAWQRGLGKDLMEHLGKLLSEINVSVRLLVRPTEDADLHFLGIWSQNTKNFFEFISKSDMFDNSLKGFKKVITSTLREPVNPKESWDLLIPFEGIEDFISACILYKQQLKGIL